MFKNDRQFHGSIFTKNCKFGLDKLRHLLNQSDTKLKSLVPGLHTISCVWDTAYFYLEFSPAPDFRFFSLVACTISLGLVFRHWIEMHLISNSFKSNPNNPLLRVHM